MKTLKLNSEGDLDLTDNTLSLIDGLDELDQRLYSILTTKKGEWFLNTDLGLSHDNLLGKAFDRKKAEIDVIEAILQEDRILTVDTVEIIFDRENRKTTINFTGTSNDGSLIEGEVTI